MQLNLTDTSLVAIDGAIKKAYPFASTDVSKWAVEDRQ